MDPMEDREFIFAETNLGATENGFTNLMSIMAMHPTEQVVFGPSLQPAGRSCRIRTNDFPPELPGRGNSWAVESTCDSLDDGEA